MLAHRVGVGRRWMLAAAGVVVVACLVLVAVALIPACPPAPRAGARVLVSSRDGRIVDWTVRSPSVPGEQSVRILLPRTYDAHPRTRWPVLYLLHGCCDSFAAWTRSSDVVQFTDDAGVIIVMPDGGGRQGSTPIGSVVRSGSGTTPRSCRGCSHRGSA